MSAPDGFTPWQNLLKLLELDNPPSVNRAAATLQAVCECVMAVQATISRATHMKLVSKEVRSGEVLQVACLSPFRGAKNAALDHVSGTHLLRQT